MAATKLVPSVVNIVTLAIGDDALQHLLLLCLLLVDALEHSQLIARIVATLRCRAHNHIEGLACLVELAQCEARIAQTVLNIVEVLITLGVVAHEELESLGSIAQIALREVSIANTVVRKLILNLAFGRTAQICLILLACELRIALGKSNLTLPVERERVIFRLQAQSLRLREQLLGTIPLTPLDGLNSAEQRHTLQCRLDVVIGVSILLDGCVCRIVVL